MKAHFLQHVPFEGLASIEGWLRRKGAAVTCTRLFAAEQLPALDAVDFVIALGGPMSVNDEDRFPWLKAEKQFLRAAMERGVPVLGICLGAQLIASSLSARVYPNRLQEIGWFPLQAVAAPEHCFQFPETCTVLHWHGETFDLPENAIHLVRSAACENQGFQIGNNVIGLQFHLEMTPESVGMLIDNSRHEMVSAPYVQSEAAIRAMTAAHHEDVNCLMDRLLDYLVSPAEG